MAIAANSGGLLHHINLARVYRGGERQTEILIRGLAAHLPRQRLITRRGTPLHTRLQDVAGIEIIPVDGRLEAMRAISGATLLHAHETHAAQVSCLRHGLSSTPYVITRRVDNLPRSDPFTRYMYRRAARVVVLSRAIGEILREIEPRLVTQRIPSVCSDFSFDESWVRRYRESLNGKFIVGQVAALDHSHKGQLTLIDAARRLSTSHPDIHFVLVGSGRDEQRVREAAADLGNVSFPGWIENVGDYLAAFDLFALPSLREGFGSVLVDAMQFGLPVVASAVGGIPDIVVDAETGVLVPPGDAGALAAAIASLNTDTELRNAMSEAARRRARDYRPELMIERYWELYQDILPRLAREA
ncbi:MAG: glycosyltransferase family 4 protein [Gammaproteobacteria bacterium]